MEHIWKWLRNADGIQGGAGGLANMYFTVWEQGNDSSEYAQTKGNSANKNISEDTLNPTSPGPALLSWMSH